MNDACGACAFVVATLFFGDVFFGMKVGLDTPLYFSCILCVSIVSYVARAFEFRQAPNTKILLCHKIDSLN